MINGLTDLIKDELGHTHDNDYIDIFLLKSNALNLILSQFLRFFEFYLFSFFEFYLFSFFDGAQNVLFV